MLGLIIIHISERAPSSTDINEMLDVSYFCITSANQAEYVGAKGYYWWDSRIVDEVTMAEIKASISILSWYSNINYK